MTWLSAGKHLLTRSDGSVYDDVVCCSLPKAVRYNRTAARFVLRAVADPPPPPTS